MIFDKIKNIDLYRGLYPNLDIAIDYIKKGEYVDLPVGKHEIVGKDVFVSVIELEGKDVATTPLKIHFLIITFSPSAQAGLCGSSNMQM